jgi:3-oxoadipate enol-lactonase
MLAEQLHLKQAGNGMPLLLIHGLLMNGEMFEPIVEKLAQNCHVLVPDLRGFGRSKQLAPPYTVEQHARDLACLLNSWSIPSTVVLGYSQGGAVAQQLVLDYPSLVSHLVLCCTFAHNQLTWQEKFEGLLMPWLVRVCSAKQLAHMAKGLTPEQSKQLETIIASNHKSRMVEATKVMLHFDSRHRLGEIACPTLVVAGATDAAVPLHHARMLAQGIPGARLHIIPDAGHEMIWTHGAQLVDAVQSFLQQFSQ